MTSDRRATPALSRSLAALAFVGLIGLLLVVAVAVAVAPKRDPVSVPQLAREEAEALLAAAGEVPEWSVPAFRRRWWDYFRPTRGVLMATERRLLFVGLVPEPITRAELAEPPPLDRTSFELDSAALIVRRARSRGSHAIEVIAPDGRAATFRIHPRAWQRAESLLVIVAAIQRQREAEMEAARRARMEDEALARAAVYHRVDRGETLISIAARFGLTVDSLAALNNLSGTRLREGDSLLVRPAR